MLSRVGLFLSYVPCLSQNSNEQRVTTRKTNVDPDFVLWQISSLLYCKVDLNFVAGASGAWSSCLATGAII
jgi:hypothetical protein